MQKDFGPFGLQCPASTKRKIAEMACDGFLSDAMALCCVCDHGDSVLEQFRRLNHGIGELFPGNQPFDLAGGNRA